MITRATIRHIDTRTLTAGPPVHILHLEVSGEFAFDAGQYLEVLHPDGTAIPLSIASPPELLPRLTLHYRSTADNPEAQRMDALILEDHLDIRGGSGDVRLLPEDASALLLIAGGTGISQALCLAQAQCQRHPGSRVTLLGCADAEGDFYYRDLLPDAPDFSARLIADPARDEGNRALAWLASNTHHWDTDFRVILSGSPAFVYAATDVLLRQGIPESRLESDVYAWAPG